MKQNMKTKGKFGDYSINEENQVVRSHDETFVKNNNWKKRQSRQVKMAMTIDLMLSPYSMQNLFKSPDIRRYWLRTKACLMTISPKIKDKKTNNNKENLVQQNLNYDNTRAIVRRTKGINNAINLNKAIKTFKALITNKPAEETFKTPSVNDKKAATTQEANTRKNSLSKIPKLEKAKPDKKTNALKPKDVNQQETTKKNEANAKPSTLLKRKPSVTVSKKAEPVEKKSLIKEIFSKSKTALTLTKPSSKVVTKSDKPIEANTNRPFTRSLARAMNIK